MSTSVLGNCTVDLKISFKKIGPGFGRGRGNITNPNYRCLKEHKTWRKPNLYISNKIKVSA
jgi:hypothetical protein